MPTRTISNQHGSREMKTPSYKCFLDVAAFSAVATARPHMFEDLILLGYTSSNTYITKNALTIVHMTDDRQFVTLPLLSLSLPCVHLTISSATAYEI